MRPWTKSVLLVIKWSKAKNWHLSSEHFRTKISSWSFNALTEVGICDVYSNFVKCGDMFDLLEKQFDQKSLKISCCVQVSVRNKVNTIDSLDEVDIQNQKVFKF